MTVTTGPVKLSPSRYHPLVIQRAVDNVDLPPDLRAWLQLTIRSQHGTAREIAMLNGFTGEQAKRQWFLGLGRAARAIADELNWSKPDARPWLDLIVILEDAGYASYSEDLYWVLRPNWQSIKVDQS